MVALGYILIGIGMADFVLWNFFDYDIYWEIARIEIPEWLWFWTAFISMSVGGFLVNLGGTDREQPSAESELRLPEKGGEK